MYNCVTYFENSKMHKGKDDVDSGRDDPTSASVSGRDDPTSANVSGRDDLTSASVSENEKHMIGTAKQVTAYTKYYNFIMMQDGEQF